MARWQILTLIAASLIFCAQGLAQDATDKPAESKRWALILTGLPGDAEHEETFRETADQLQSALVQKLQYPAEQVIRFPEARLNAPPKVPATAEAMRSMLAEVNQKLQPQDSLWVFLLGHGNYDGKAAWFHTVGKDPSNEDVGRWFADVKCREQVIWLTQSSSGWFVKPLSRAGRIVIAATAADDESNETEFPHALATAIQQPLEKLDLDQDKAVSVAELYTATIAEVVKRFQSDKRLPTEHPQLDDNGDGVGSEVVIPQKGSEPEAAAPPNSKRDGELAKRTIVPFRAPD